MHDSPRSRLLAYGAALPALAAGVIARWHLGAILGQRALYSTFFPAVMVAAYFGGLWPGLIVMLVATVLANAVVDPRFTLQLKGPGDALAMVLFVVTGAAISFLCESLHRARRRILVEERSRSEQAVRDAEERFRQMAENINEIFWVADLGHTRIMYVSPGYNEVWGRSSQSLYEQPRTWFDSIHPDDRPAVIQNLEERRQGVFNDLEFRIQRPDGSIRWVRSRAFPIKDPEGQLSRIAGLAEDVTDRKSGEIALRESEERFRSTFENAGVGIALCDVDGNFTRVNQAFTDIVGYSDGELRGRSYREITHSDDQFIDLQQIGKILRGDLPGYSIEKRYVRKDGADVCVVLSASVLQRDAQRKPVSLIAIIQDISERKRAEAAVRDSEERFRGTFENAAVGIGHLASDGRWIRVNQRLCAITGFTREELLERTFQDITHAEDLSNSVEPFRQLWQGQVPDYSIEKRYVRKDGSFVWIEATVSLKRDPDGDPTNTIAIIQDISERKRLEEELRQAKEVAESANHAKDEFLANVSHEIRTPMNAILGMTELVLDTPLGDDQRQNLRTVRSAADNLLGIINDLLDFSKIEAGKLELDSAEFSLRALLGDIMRALGARAHRKGLELLSVVQPNVPDALIGDGGRLRQVLLNLVGNAIKFTERGEVLVRIDTIAEQTANDNRVSLRFSVRDTGIGIPREKQSAIFRAFEQEDTSTTRKYGGTGLGLTISARLVALMSGSISVESDPGQGSIFTFDAQFTKQSKRADVAETAQRVQLRDLRVLVVDDNATNRKLMEKWLRDWQMDPAAVADGMAAMDALWHGVAIRKPYSLLLLDARMPDTDGLTLAAKIRDRAELSGSRIVLLASGDRPGDSSRFRGIRIDGYLLKPIQQDELLEAIYSVMSRPSDAAAPRTTFTERAKPRTSMQALRVLVAEDREFNAQLMHELLSKRGHTVRLAGDGREALQLAHADDFDLLLLDVHMPELDGFQVIEAVRRRERGTGSHLPVIALTARSRKEDRERCLAAGMDGFLAKPIHFEELWATIDDVLKSTPKRDSTAEHVLSASVLLAACGGDDEILQMIAQRLQLILPTELAAVRRALENGDAVGLRESAHQLCGMVSAFSSAVGGVASEVEDSASRSDLDVARPLVEKLECISQELLKVVATGLSVALLRD